MQLADAGYIAILVDGFGPRGYPEGFPRGSYLCLPEELNEVMVRLLDAYGVLAYLWTRPDVTLVLDRARGLVEWRVCGDTRRHARRGVGHQAPTW